MGRYSRCRAQCACRERVGVQSRTAAVFEPCLAGIIPCETVGFDQSRDAGDVHIQVESALQVSRSIRVSWTRCVQIGHDFEVLLEVMANLYASGPADPDRARDLQRRFHLDMDVASIPRLIETYSLTQIGRASCRERV